MIIKRRKSQIKTDNVQEIEVKEEKLIPAEKALPSKEEDIFEGFNFQEIDFSQRSERRRGDRRRGYRRIDDRNLISRAQEEAILIKEESTKEGYRTGLAQAEEEIIRLKKSIDEFFAYKDELCEKLSSDILDIALDVAEKIIKKEVSVNKEILTDMVCDALDSIAKDENKIILKVSPMDVEYTKELVPEILSTGQIEAKIYVTADQNVYEGSVVVETSNGVIDANISTQLNVIKEAFKQI